MNKFVLFFVLVLCSFNIDAQTWQWAKSSLCTNGSSEMEAIAYDKLGGYIYVGGCNMSDSLCLPPFTIHNVHDSQQLYIVKYDTVGNVLWYRTNNSGQGGVQNITTDARGNLYVFGVFVSPRISFGTDTIYNNNFYSDTMQDRNYCYFVSKYDTYGNLKWITDGINESTFGLQTMHCGNIATDAIGNSYICTYFVDSVIHIGSYTFTNVNYIDSDYCTADIVLAKYDSSGNLLWAKSFGGNGDDKSSGVAIGANNKVYVTGSYSSPLLSFGSTTLSHTGALTTYTGQFYPDAFLVEFDTSGNVLWAKSSYGNAQANAIALSADNDIFIAGATYDTVFVAFGLDTLRNLQLSNGAFLARFDTAGNSIWAKGFYPISLGTGGWTFNNLFGITTDPCNNVWAAGIMNHDTAGIILDSGVILRAPTGAIEDPMFFVGYSASGSLVQYLSLKSGGDDGPGLTSDCEGNIYIATDSWITMPLGSDTAYSHGAENMFVAKYSPNLGCTGSCGSLVSENITNSGTVQILNIYPNPTQNELTISSSTTITHITIANLIGQTLYNNEYDTPEVKVNVAGLPAGIYLIRINDIEVRKFVKE